MSRQAPSPSNPSSEFSSFEPLRIAFAVGALLLGLLMGIH